MGIQHVQPPVVAGNIKIIIVADNRARYAGGNRRVGRAGAGLDADFDKRVADYRKQFVIKEFHSCQGQIRRSDRAAEKDAAVGPVEAR